MPEKIVDIDLSAETGAAPQETYSDVLLIGSGVPGNEPADTEIEYNDVDRHGDATDVADTYGEGSDIHVASQAVQQMGADHWLTVMAEREQFTETIADSDTTSVSTGFVDTTPVAGDVDSVEVTVDGVLQDVVPTTETPPTPPTEDNTTAFNFDTGELAVGNETSGAGEGIEVSYESIAWNDALSAIANTDANIATLANTQVDRSYIGDLDELVTFAPSNRMVVFASFVNGNRLESEEAAMDLAHDVGGYIPSADFATFTHKSDADVASYVAGQASTEEAWFDVFADGDGYPFSSDFYRPARIGDPGTPGTFEGGDSEDNQGPTNVIHLIQNTQVLSNSLTTAGAGSNYRYIDIRRTESMLAREVIRELESLRLRQDHIGFDRFGRTLILDSINSVMARYVGQSKPLNDFEVYIPHPEDLTRDDRANRVWGEIDITYELSGNVHTFSVSMTATI